ncbi:MAG: Uma2 family endonuclease [Gemmatimonadetes bacterium]|nr:Uma2 family endonuclease [Gemmatimonadota bacterium]
MDMVAHAYYTADMVRALPNDGNRYETVFGELLVTPAPKAWHQEVLRRLSRVVEHYLDRYPVGHPFNSPADISWSDDVLVQPDLFVVDIGEAKTMDWARMKTLLLAVEILSPTTARHDRFTKRKLYQDVGIPTYWIVDPDAQSVEVWTVEDRFPTVCTETVEWKPGGAGEPLVVDLADLFRPL